jgi:hypothetical protein
MIRYKCPNCGDTLVAPNNCAGRISTCLRCQTILRIPALDTFASGDSSLCAGQEPVAVSLMPIDDPPAARGLGRKWLIWISCLIFGLGGSIAFATVLCIIKGD